MAEMPCPASFYCKSPFHQGAETGAFGGNGNVDSWTVPHVGQVTLAFSSICSWLWPAIPSRNAVNVGPQSLQRSAVFSSVIVVLSVVDAKPVECNKQSDGWKAA